MLPSVFFGYPSGPEVVRHTVADAALLIGGTGLVAAVTWESLHVGGRLVIGQVLAAIEQSDLCVF